MLKPLPVRWSLAIMVVVGLVLSLLVLAQPDGRLHLLVPAQEGDGALVVTPDGYTILIDGGADGALLASWLGARMPFGQRRIDTLVLTRADPRTLPGQLAAMRRYQIGGAWRPSGAPRSPQDDAWTQMLAERQTLVQELTPGSQLQVGECVLHTLTEHTQQLTLALHCNTTTVYFLQAITAEAEQQLVAVPLPPATAVVYPWDRQTNNALLRQLQPATVVFSEGNDGQDIRQSFAQRRIGPAQLVHETVHGDIAIVSDGYQTYVQTTQKETR